MQHISLVGTIIPAVVPLASPPVLELLIAPVSEGITVSLTTLSSLSSFATS